MKYSEVNHSGYIITKSGRCIAYDLYDGYITIHANEYILELENTNIVIASSFDKGKYLFFTRLPINLTDNIWFPQNYKHPIDCIIKDYKNGVKYTKAIFSFSELQCICPSSIIFSELSNEDFLIPRKPKTIKAFEITIENMVCKVEFVVTSKFGYSLGHGNNIGTFSEVVISFDETFDLKFLYKIYLVVDSVFAFICNRKNTECIKMSVYGNVTTETLDNGLRDKILVDTKRPCKSEIYFIDKRS